MKTFWKIVLLVAVCAVAITAMGEAMSFFRKQQGEFRFEDYSNAEEAQAALLEMHPVGSDVEALRKTLKLAGAEMIHKKIPSYETNPTVIAHRRAEMETSSVYIFKRDWLGLRKYFISIKLDDEKIVELVVYKDFMGL